MKTEHTTDGEADSEDEAENEKYEEELHYISSRLEEMKTELDQLQSRQVHNSFVLLF